jgi:hypothetical protein
MEIYLILAVVLIAGLGLITLEALVNIGIEKRKQNIS